MMSYMPKSVLYIIIVVAKRTTAIAIITLQLVSRSIEISKIFGSKSTNTNTCGRTKNVETYDKVTASWPQPGIDYTSTLLDDSASVTILRSPAVESVRSQAKVRGYRNKIHYSKKSTSWWDERLIDANNDVTLTLTLQITSAHMKDKTLVQSFTENS